MGDYDDFVAAIRNCGYYADVRRRKDSSCDVLCSSMPKTGSSFWVERLSPSSWVLGTWGGALYRLPEHADPVEVVVDCLEHQQHRGFGFLDELLVGTYELEVDTQLAFTRRELSAAEAQALLTSIAQIPTDATNLRSALAILSSARLGPNADQEKELSAAVATLAQTIAAITCRSACTN